MTKYFEMSARERVEMTVAVLAALQAEGADVEFDAYKTSYGVTVTVTKYDLDTDNDTQQDLSFELYKLNEEGNTEHERGRKYEAFYFEDEDDDFVFCCEYEDC